MKRLPVLFLTLKRNIPYTLKNPQKSVILKHKLLKKEIWLYKCDISNKQNLDLHWLSTMYIFPQHLFRQVCKLYLSFFIKIHHFALNFLICKMSKFTYINKHGVQADKIPCTTAKYSCKRYCQEMWQREPDSSRSKKENITKVKVILIWPRQRAVVWPDTAGLMKLRGWFHKKDQGNGETQRQSGLGKNYKTTRQSASDWWTSNKGMLYRTIE